MAFEGFSPADFEVFAIPGFQERMQAIRSTIRPKLIALGEDLTPWLETATGLAFHPHVAAHARRKVNPPDDTWVAFSRSHRGYKRYGHYAVGLSLAGVYVRYVVKAEADDKPAVKTALERDGVRLLGSLEGWRNYQWFESDHPTDGLWVQNLTDDDVRATATVLGQKKTAALAVGASFAAGHPTVGNGPALVAQAVEIMQEMLPLYLAGAGAGAAAAP